MFNAIIIVAAACVVAYFLRRNFRRAWYVLRTGDEHPDWEKLGGDYFIAPWESGKQKTGGSEDTHSIVLAFPGLPFWRLFSRKNRKRECCNGGAFCMRESKSRPPGGLGLGALGARSTSLR